VTTGPPVPPAAELEVLSEADCRLLLNLGAVGRIAFVIDDFPVVLPVNYRLMSDESGLWIVLRTRPGHTVDNAPEHVAFEIDGVDYERQEGWSVLVRGVLHHLDHNEIELLTGRFDPKSWVNDRTSWLSIKPHTITGRRLRAPASGWELPPDAYL